MATEILPLAPELVPVARRFAETTWPERPQGDAFHRWRWVEPDFLCGFLAVREGECLAMECAWRRPWRIDGERVEVLEVFDWFCRPDLRNVGLGVRVMQRMMQEQRPLLLVGGSEDTRGLLPRLGWQQLGESVRYLLPLGAERAATALRQRWGVPRALGRVAFAVSRRGIGPRPRAVPRDGRVRTVACAGDEVHELYRAGSSYRSVPLWTEAHLRWLVAGFSGAGHFVPFLFLRSGRLVGFALLRVFPTRQGCEGEIIELFAPEPDADLYTWMVSELALCADGFGAAVLGASTTCAAVRAGLQRNRFLRRGTSPIWWWDRAGSALPEPQLIGSNTGDAALLPYAPSGWPGRVDGDASA